ncbi:MAG: acetyl-CoA C-acyltransferase [Betaproteobacteria bacterium]|nr:acetyl-CoA C-acyltransferase [Betaproteobacteria bacterium]
MPPANPAVVIGALRTPRGAAKESGALHPVAPVELLAGVLRALHARTGVDTAQVDDGVFGCVTQTGEQGGNIGKAASLLADWSPHLSAVTINRYCASGLSAVNWAAQQARDADGLAVAGGVEMMSRVPMFGDQPTYTIDKALAARIGFVPPPWSSDLVATREGTSREDCDRYAALSQSRALAARQRGLAPSMVPVTDADRRMLLDHDENIRAANTIEKLASLRTVYEPGANGLDAWGLAREPGLGEIRHVHTAGNAPCMADGAAAVLLGTEAAARRHGLPMRARILAQAEACVPLTQTGAVEATRKALARAGLGVADIDLWEVRDSFAAITLHYIKSLGIELQRFNVNGSSIALGHPMGATGAMLVSCLLDEMERRGLRHGVAALPGAFGVATATVFERVH